MDILHELRAIDEASMYENPASTKRVIDTAIAEIERLRSQLAHWKDAHATVEAELTANERQVDTMRTLAKANNDLAKMQKAQIQELRQSQLRLMNDLQACKDALAQWDGHDDA